MTTRSNAVRAIVVGAEPPDDVVRSAALAGVDLERPGEGSPSGVVGYVMNSFGDLPLGKVTEQTLAQHPDLRVVVYLGQSLEPGDYASFVDLDAVRRNGIALATTPAGGPVAEAAMGLVVAADLGLPALMAGQAMHPGRLGLSGSTLGIVGFGQIGRRVAELAAGFDMNIVYFSRRDHGASGAPLNAQRVSLQELCRVADFITVHLANSAPAGLIGRELEQAIGAALINTTSAPKLVDPAALHAALDNGTIRRAVIEGTYQKIWQSRLTGLGIDRYAWIPAYSSWDTPAARTAGWNQAAAAVRIAAEHGSVPFRLV